MEIPLFGQRVLLNTYLWFLIVALFTGVITVVVKIALLIPFHLMNIRPFRASPRRDEIGSVDMVAATRAAGTVLLLNLALHPVRHAFSAVNSSVARDLDLLYCQLATAS